MTEQLAGVSLETLLRALTQVELQATALLVTERSGSTHEVAETVMRECERLSDSVRDEIKALKRIEAIS